MTQRPDTCLSPFSRPLQWALAVVFCLVLLVPGLTQLTGLELQSGDFEQRFKAEAPGMPTTMKELSRFPKQFDRWYADHFGLRNLMIKSYVLLKYRVLGAIQVNKVVFGRDGWLFFTLAEPTADPISSYRGTTLLTEPQLALIAAGLNAWDAWCRERGIVFALFIAPNKAMIFPEQLPPSIVPVDRPNRMAQFLEYLSRHTTALVVDPTAALKARKNEYIYFKTDTHWTNVGALHAMEHLRQRVVDRLQTETGASWAPLELGNYNMTSTTTPGGDLANMIIMTEEMPEYHEFLAPLVDRNATAAAEGRQRPRAILYGDSFSKFLPQYLAQDFEYVETATYAALDPDYIEANKPALLVLEIVERNLPLLPNLLNNLPNELMPQAPNK
ncbi:DHHW family protein [Megalodesulfovibrio paquesii]